jgi:hypothetical protein
MDTNLSPVTRTPTAMTMTTGTTTTTVTPTRRNLRPDAAAKP